MTPDRAAPAVVLERSGDRAALLGAGRLLAASSAPADLALIGRHLRRAEFLERLDPEEAYLRDADHLRVGAIIDALGANPAGAALDELAALGRDPVFLARGERVEMLLAAAARRRPLPPVLAPLFRDRCAPESGFTNVVVRLLVENRSPPALAVLGDVLADPRYPQRTREIWLRNRCLPRRLEPAMIALARDLLGRSGDADARRAVIEAWFDFRREEWYVPAFPIAGPPPLADAGDGALRGYLELASVALAEPIDEPLRDAVRAEAEAARRELLERGAAE